MSRWDEIEPEGDDLDRWDDDDDALLDAAPEGVDRAAVVDLAAAVTSTRGHRSGDSAVAVRDRVLVRAMTSALEFEDPRPVLVAHLGAVAYAVALRTGAADPMAEAEEAVDAAAVLDAAAVAAVLVRRLDALLGLLRLSGGVKS